MASVGGRAASVAVVCGIAGVVRLRPGPPLEREPVERMLDAIAHRGPDGRGVVECDGAVLGAVRLAVRDRSDRAAQPMSTADGRHHLVYNGEIYDIDEQRSRLDPLLPSCGDTEVLLGLLARDGVEPTVARLDAMFAFALWDQAERKLALARDRFGEKPLFWAEQGGCLWFASEEKALFAAGISAEVDPRAWPELLVFRHVPGERTPYARVRRLLPGHILTVAGGTVAVSEWHLAPRPSDESVDGLLEASVRRRLHADVPVGIFLSGGVDSSSVAAIATDVAGPGLPAYTVGYPGNTLDESERARALAATLGLRFRNVVVEPSRLPALLEEATWLRGEPLSHAAAPLMLALAREAREDVTVVLSGEGADEVFAGYGRYVPFRSRWRAAVAALTSAARHGRRPPGGRSLPIEAMVLLGARQVPGVDLRSIDLDYRRAVAAEAVRSSSHPLHRVLAYEQRIHLDAILANADRNTMGAGLECRVPFLDAALGARAASARSRDLVRRRTTKVLLRRAMAERLPAEIVHRQKLGWVAPWNRYLREVPGLRRYVEQLPTSGILEQSRLEPSSTRQAVQRFLAGERGSFAPVWTLTRVALWHDVCVEGRRNVLA